MSSRNQHMSSGGTRSGHARWIAIAVAVALVAAGVVLLVLYGGGGSSAGYQPPAAAEAVDNAACRCSLSQRSASSAASAAGSPAVTAWR